MAFIQILGVYFTMKKDMLGNKRYHLVIERSF